jgi:Flp pilus assembly protein TadD
MPEFRRPVYLSGTVVMDDGTPPPEPVVIERVCDGRRVPEGYTTSKGHFNIDLGGDNTLASADASVSGGGRDRFSNDPFTSGGTLGGGAAGLGQVNLMGCELRAVLPGFTSEAVQLGRRSVFDNPNVGTIVLRRIGNVQGTSISFTSLAAPKNAKKAYEKAFNETRKPKPNFKNAVKELDKAVAEYPQYAAAWYLLGRIRASEDNVPGAREAFEKAIEADGKYLNPYAPLVRMALAEGSFGDAKQLSKHVLELNPHLTEVQFYHAVASFELGEIEEAEKSLAMVQSAADGKSYPGVHHLMGTILAKKGQFAPAAAEYREFLKIDAQSPSAAAIQRQLTEWEALGVIERAAAPATPQTQPQ